MNTTKTIFIYLAFIVLIVIIDVMIKIPINNNINTDVQINKVNDSLKIEVDNLDSIKDAKIIEVQKIDNDSTIKLFYRLIK